MNSILEQALVHLLNEEHEKAEELMHQFVVDRARQIHESLREADEAEADVSELDEELFTEADLADATDNLEDDLGDAAGSDADVAGADGLSDDIDADAGVEADDAGLDGDMDADAGCEGDEGCLEDKVEDLEAQLAELTAEFEAVMAEFEASEGDDVAADDDALGADLSADDADLAADDADLAADDAELAHDDEEELQMHEDEDFDDITESVVDELKKVQPVVTTDDGKGATGQKLGGGEKVSTLKGTKVDAKPIVRKSEEHKGFARETPAGYALNGQKKNTTGDNIRATATTGTEKHTGYQPKVSKGAEIAKPVKGNVKSNIPGGNPKPVK